ncbi:MAG: tRNA (guanosine(37)-N1)-methyltransferase TrmD, partial [Myxococcota bacterium]
MRFGVVSLFPDLIDAGTTAGVIGRGRASGAFEVLHESPRGHASDRHATVDARPYGGGAGMVMQAEPLIRATDNLKRRMACAAPVALMSPRGQALTQALAAHLAGHPGLILIAGRYEGIDQRYIDSHVDLEISVGDAVLSGGELPALAVIDAVARTLPGVLGNSESAADESFADGLLEHPQFTRPEDGEWGRVPAALLSGDHRKIDAWRLAQALYTTYHSRPDLLVRRGL